MNVPDWMVPPEARSCTHPPRPRPHDDCEHLDDDATRRWFPDDAEVDRRVGEIVAEVAKRREQEND